MPVYKLLGGAVRDRVRVYAHWGIFDTSDEGLARSKARLETLLKQGGYTAFKGGLGGKWRAMRVIEPSPAPVMTAYPEVPAVEIES